MNFTQNEKLNQLSETSIVIGVDIASELHYARAFDWRGVELGKVFKFCKQCRRIQEFIRMDWPAKKADTKGQHYSRSRANGSLLVWFSILPERTKYKASSSQPIPCKAE